MSKKRRKCVLSDPNNREVDLRQFEKIIIDTINETVPGKNPQVFKDHLADRIPIIQQRSFYFFLIAIGFTEPRV